MRKTAARMYARKVCGIGFLDLVPHSDDEQDQSISLEKLQEWVEGLEIPNGTLQEHQRCWRQFYNEFDDIMRRRG